MFVCEQTRVYRPQEVSKTATCLCVLRHLHYIHCRLCDIQLNVHMGSRGIHTAASKTDTSCYIEWNGSVVKFNIYYSDG
jgi:hypothetical protein